ncbi:calcium-dependent protein kinase-like protein [Tanacetum coccineum]
MPNTRDINLGGEVGNMLSKNSKPSFLAAITKATSPRDSSDKSGSMTYEELKTGRPWLGSKLSEIEVKKLMEAADVDGNRTIDYINFRNAVDFISSNLDKFEGYVSCLTLLFEPTSKISEAVINYARIHGDNDLEDWAK